MGDNTRYNGYILCGNIDREVALTKLLPESIQTWIRDRAPIPLSAETIYKFYLVVGEKEALRMLRWEQMQDTALCYGPEHPFVQDVLVEIRKSRGLK
jgi:hypothetical protein